MDNTGIISDIASLETSLVNTIQFTDNPKMKASAEIELAKLQDLKQRYVDTTNNIYNKAITYDTAVNELLGYQYDTAGYMTTINDKLTEEQRIALQAIDNKRRMTQINTYYSDKYEDYIFIIKMVILLCVIIIVLSVLTKKNILPSRFYSLLIIISCSIILAIIIMKWISIRARDPINYNQFKFYVPSYTPTTTPDIYGYDSSTGVPTESTLDSGDGSDGTTTTDTGDSGVGGAGRISRIIMNI
jgi:hypothetical protein